MNKGIFLKFILGLGAMIIAAQAQAASCHILVNAPCPAMNKRAATYFQDNASLAQVNPRRCLQRAKEWHAYCGLNANQVAYSYFFNGKNFTAANQSNGESRVFYIANEAGSWVEIFRGPE